MMDLNENVQSAELQDTIPEESQEVQTQTEVENTATASQEQQLNEEEVARVAEQEVTQAATEEEQEPPPFVTVRYNHEDRNLSKDEAVNLVQKGMHLEKLHNKLDYIASLQGTDVNSLVDKMVEAPEAAHRKYLEELYGENSEDIEIGMDIFRAKQSESYKKILADRQSAQQERETQKRQSTESRLADEYKELKSEITDAPEYKDLPDSVIRDAASGKRDLYSAYLRYLHNEKTKVDTAKQNAAQAEAASTGSLEANDTENISEQERQFIAGLWGRN